MDRWKPERDLNPGMFTKLAAELSRTGRYRDGLLAREVIALLRSRGEDIREPYPNIPAISDEDTSEWNLFDEIAKIVRPVERTYVSRLPALGRLSSGFIINPVYHKSYPTKRWHVAGDIGGIAARHDFVMRTGLGSGPRYVPKSVDITSHEDRLMFARHTLAMVHLLFEDGDLVQLHISTGINSTWENIFGGQSLLTHEGREADFRLRVRRPVLKLSEYVGRQTVGSSFTYDPVHDSFPEHKDESGGLGIGNLTTEQFTMMLRRTRDQLPDPGPR